ncbi:MAG: hypothetical protein J7521_07280 [Caulobacter sp.]|nr:hypothetical protein [Caulobacter sp.]
MNTLKIKPPSKVDLEAIKAILTTFKGLYDLTPTWLRILTWTLVVVIAPTLMINGYLRVYGQPGLGAFGDNLIVGIIQSAGLFLVLLVALIGLFLAAPILTRHFFAHGQNGLGLADYVNTPIFGPAKEPWTGRGKARPGWAYLACNLSLIGLALVQVAQQQLACLRQDWLIWPLLSLSPIACVVLVQATLDRDERAPGARTIAAVLGVAFALSAWSWVSAVTMLLTPSFPPPQTQAWHYWAGVLGAACLIHLALSAASHYRSFALVMIGAVVIIMFWCAPGYRLLVFNALRAGNAGGGVAIYYPDPARRTLGGPMKAACLILNAGEYRIVRLTDDPQQCGAVPARKFFGELLRMEVEADRRTALCGVMAIKRDAFAGSLALPPENRKPDDKTPPTALGCAKEDA